MALRTRQASIVQFWQPFRNASQRFGFAILLLLSSGLLVLGKVDHDAVERARLAVADVTAPLLILVQQPIRFATGVIEGTRNAVALYRENAQLRADNATLLQWQFVGRRLEAENDGLRSLLHYQPQAAAWFISAQVIGTEGGAFSRSLLIDRGTADGVAKGQAALGGNGFVGRVAEVGRRTARILLLTDVNSRVPIALGEKHERAIVAGDNTQLPIVEYLPVHAAVAVGDRAVTSGDGGVLPPGLLVGTVASIQDGVVRLAPAADLGRVDYVRIEDFGLAGMLPSAAAPAARPASPANRDQAPGGT